MLLAIDIGNTQTVIGLFGDDDGSEPLDGVAGGVQYTVPNEAAITAVRSGSRPTLTTREKHTRDCFVVLADGADASAVRESIVTMPDYFADYDTSVTFITADECRTAAL